MKNACRENIGVFLNRWKSWLSQSIGTNHTIEEVSKGAVNCLLRSSHDVPAGQYIFSTRNVLVVGNAGTVLYMMSRDHWSSHHRIWRYIWMIGQTFSNYNSVVLYYYNVCTIVASSNAKYLGIEVRMLRKQFKVLLSAGVKCGC
jgi:hypothetical protein